jgi:hypothetical protein
MFAAVKIVLAFVIACGSLIAVIVESTHPGFVTCFCVSFAVGAIAGEVVRARRRRSVRSLGRAVRHQSDMHALPCLRSPSSQVQSLPE